MFLKLLAVVAYFGGKYEMKLLYVMYLIFSKRLTNLSGKFSLIRSMSQKIRAPWLKHAVDSVHIFHHSNDFFGYENKAVTSVNRNNNLGRPSKTT